MNVTGHIDSLKSKKEKLQKQIDAEYSNPSPDPLQLSSLKRKKLRIKEEIEKFMKLPANTNLKPTPVEG